MVEEIEKKVLVSHEEFLRCLESLRSYTGTAGDTYVQVNYYFDTSDSLLSRNRSMLRVRRKKNALFLQYKNKREQRGDLFVCGEWEAPLDSFPRTVNPHTRFPEAPDVSCALLGDLVTLRTDFIFPDAVVSLDESIYFGCSDYEIEIEGEPNAIEILSAFLNPEGVSRKGNGKFSRFMRQYRSFCDGKEGEIL